MLFIYLVAELLSWGNVIYLIILSTIQTCQTPIRPITPRSLLDSICWSVSDPTSTASIYTDSSSIENAFEDHTIVLSDAKEDGSESQASFVNLSRPLTERLICTLVSNSPIFVLYYCHFESLNVGDC